MIEVKVLGLPILAVGRMAVVAAGIGAAAVVLRNPERMRDLVRIAAGGVQRIGVALAETREELADLWAEVREEAPHDVEEAAFAAASAQADAETAVEEEMTSARPRKRQVSKAAKKSANKRGPRPRSAARKPRTTQPA